MKKERALELVESELTWIMNDRAPIYSPKEGYAVMLAEFDDLWDEIKDLRSKSMAIQSAHLRHEAVHVAAMAVRFLVDICNE
jgi:hypothetical protein